MFIARDTQMKAPEGRHVREARKLEREQPKLYP